MNPYYADDSVTVYRGDALDALKALPNNSVHACVTDPPYGLEFMGKDWDSPWKRGDDVNADAGFHGGGIDATKGLPSFTGSTNPKCLNCKGTNRGRRDGTAKVKVCTCDSPSFQAAELDRQSGTLTSGKVLPHHADNGKSAGALGAYTGAPGRESYGDSGGASRFFPTFRYTAKASASERPKVDGVAHPTVKPLELMRWLIRLITPPGGLVLDPFAGSGTTGEAAIHEHKRAILIEREPTYLPLIVTRLSKPMEVGFHFEEPA